MGNDNNQNLVLGNDNAIKNKNMNLSKNNSTNLVMNNKYCPEYDEFQKQKPARFPIVFEWEGNENNVYLTGSFCDWHQFFEMEKVEDPNKKNNYKFFLTLFLPKGAYQYKFKIDDQWKCNSNFPTCSDKNGNINNIVDLTKQKREDGNTDFSTSYVTTGHEQKLDETKISNYSQFFDNEYTTNINNCLYTNENENENTKDNPIEFNYDDLYYNFLEEKEENDNYSYKKILPMRNEFIDHFTLNKNTIEKYILKPFYLLAFIANIFYFRFIINNSGYFKTKPKRA